MSPPPPPPPPPPSNLNYDWSRSKILCCVALVYNSYFFRTAVLRKLSFIRFSYKRCNFSRGCLTRQDGLQNHDKVYFATNCLCLLLRCFLFIDSFILHGLIVETEIKCQNYSRVSAKFALQPSFAEKPWGRAQPQIVKKWRKILHYSPSKKKFPYKCLKTSS